MPVTENKNISSFFKGKCIAKLCTMSKTTVLLLTLLLSVFFSGVSIYADTVEFSQSVIDGTAETVSDSIWIQHAWVSPVTATIYSIITFPTNPAANCGLTDGRWPQSGINISTNWYPDPQFGSGSVGTSTKLASGACLFSSPTGYSLTAGSSYNIFFGVSGGREEDSPNTIPKGSVSDTTTGHAGHANSNGLSYRRDDTQIADMAFILCSTQNCEIPAPTSAVTMSSPSSQTYNGNPIVFSGTYTNANTFDEIQFDVVLGSSTPIKEVPSYKLPATSGVDLPWGPMSYYFGYSGPYTARARLHDTSTGSTTAWTATTSFAIATTTLNPAYTFESVIPTVKCSDWDLFCMGQQLVGWAIKPSDASVDRMLSLNSQLSMRTPFVYVYQVKDIVTGAFTASSTTASTTIAISVQSNPFNTAVATSVTLISKDMVQNMPLTSTIRAILTAMLWIGLLTTIYYQGLYIHRKNKQ